MRREIDEVVTKRAGVDEEKDEKMGNEMKVRRDADDEGRYLRSKTVQMLLIVVVH